MQDEIGIIINRLDSKSLKISEAEAKIIELLK